MNTLYPATDAWHQAVDPSFALDIQGDLKPQDSVGTNALLRSLVTRIQRDPLDLHAHTLRILTLIDLEEPEALFAALIDLFLATGAKAAPLRLTLLDAAAHQLPPEENAYLRQRLNLGLGKRQLLPNTQGSCLSLGLIGTANLVQSQFPARPTQECPVQDPLIVATRLLEDGQLDEARKVLEDAWIDKPESHEIAMELFEIHRRLRDPVALKALAARLSTVGGELPPFWASIESTG